MVSGRVVPYNNIKEELFDNNGEGLKVIKSRDHKNKIHAKKWTFVRKEGFVAYTTSDKDNHPLKVW